MQSETSDPLTTATGTISGLLAGMYQTWNGGSLLHTVLTTTLTAAVSCLVSFLMQWLLSKIKR